MALPAATVLHHRYRILRIVAHGGMGVVYEAADETLFNRRVAVKEIVVPLADPDMHAETLRRFTREARLLAEIQHPGIPHIYDHFQEGRHSYYLVMEYVEGRTLAEMLPHAPYPSIPIAVGWIRQIADIIHHLHTRHPPIVFRDLKPANIMISDDGQVKLIDFGIAWSATNAPTQGLGTPGFAPPEQYARGDCDPGLDVYALGATAYRILTGHDPPEATARAFSGVVLEPVNHINPLVSEDLARLVHHLLEVLPRKRPQDMQEVLNRLDGLATAPARLPSVVPNGQPAPVLPITGTVLIADDDPRIQRLVQTTLQSAGFHTIVVGNGLEAVESARMQRPDIIIMDVEMPTMGGTDACRVIRASQDTPILMLTALSSETDRVVGLELGADDYVTKPFSPRELLARVRALLRRKR